MIIQQNKANPNPYVKMSSDKPSIIVESFNVDGVQVQGKEFDLTPFQGKPFRLYLDKDGQLSDEQNKDHYWLLAEIIVPEVEMVGFGDNLEEKLNLDDEELRVFELPKRMEG